MCKIYSRKFIDAEFMVWGFCWQHFDGFVFLCAQWLVFFICTTWFIFYPILDYLIYLSEITPRIKSRPIMSIPANYLKTSFNYKHFKISDMINFLQAVCELVCISRFKLNNITCTSTQYIYTHFPYCTNVFCYSLTFSV